MQLHERDLSDFTLTTKPAGALTADERAMVFALFDLAYRQANHGYLANSLTKLRYITLAWHEGAPAGFGLADMRLLDLPRLPGQAVAMAGMCCIDDRFRRRGLFGALERHSMAAAGERPAGRMITCGRVAHPASFRTMTSNPTHIPRPGVPITAWQQEVGAAIAAAYGVADFDPASFVCHGSGEPIGYPNLVMDVSDDEWRVFDGVDRDRGDSLLGLAWIPDAPPGWDD
jgi:hypothetical protein